MTKKGKPQGSEFTIFAALVLVDCSNNSIPQEKKFIVCSIGTGTKCIGHDLIEKDINNGYLLHDCHAEVMARRSFMKFMYNLMESGKCSEYFDWVEEVERWKLKNNFELYMILTELPCMLLDCFHNFIRRIIFKVGIVQLLILLVLSVVEVKLLNKTARQIMKNSSTSLKMLNRMI